MNSLSKLNWAFSKENLEFIVQVTEYLKHMNESFRMFIYNSNINISCFFLVEFHLI